MPMRFAIRTPLLHVLTVSWLFAPLFAPKLLDKITKKILVVLLDIFVNS
jgi:hypothetical protein